MQDLDIGDVNTVVINCQALKIQTVAYDYNLITEFLKQNTDTLQSLVQEYYL